VKKYCIGVIILVHINNISLIQSDNCMISLTFKDNTNKNQLMINFEEDIHDKRISNSNSYKS